ncbi:TPA: hypothetical protein N0F65_000578 [Lagenidium giganteum]|uniref:DNA-directed RNA polymerase I subunit RPA49 n=1 Tax=Lagenidium giganteum TaxID=4803 RepID=A0AAV2YHD8_9STRA|nr:TPA: hypothetical protein N0F65_000578 [Lagenidium giganteum]
MSKRTVHLQHSVALDASAPLVATFRNGPPPPEKRKDLSFEMFENPAKKQRLVIASTDKIAYQAANFGYMSSANDCASYVVGIYDKTTQEVRLCNINQIYVMQQSVKGAADHAEESKDETRTYMERRRDLVEAFGSKKSKRIQRSMEENMVNLQNVSGATSISQTLKKKVDKAQQQLNEERAKDASFTTDAAALASTRNAILPPCNLDAATPDKVYELRRFLDPQVMESLKIKAKEWIEALKSSNVADFAATNNLPSVVTRLLLSLQTPYSVGKMCHVVYLTYLLEIFNTHFPLRKSAAMFSEEKDIPLVVTRHLLRLFTDSTQNESGHMTYLQPKQFKDKTILYMLVVALTINNYSLDLTEIAADLKKSAMTLTAYCRQLGCGVDKVKAEAATYGGASSALSKKQVHRVVLTLPLRFPQVKRMGGGPRR